MKQYNLYLIIALEEMIFYRKKAIFTEIMSGKFKK